MARRILGTVVTLVVAASTLTGVQSAASARDGVQVTAGDVVFKRDACFASDVAVSGLDPAVDHDVEVRGPVGGGVDSRHTTEQSEVSFSVPLCVGTNAVGTYAVEVDGTSLGTFDVTKPRIALERRSRRVMIARLSLDGAPLQQRRVHVQFKSAGSWHNALRLTTNQRGRVGVKCRRHHRCPQKLRFEYRDFVYSPTFRLYRGRTNARAVVNGRSANEAASLRKAAVR
jgi:hypothetical protein